MNVDKLCKYEITYSIFAIDNEHTVLDGFPKEKKSTFCTRFNVETC